MNELDSPVEQRSWFERNKFPNTLVVFGWIILAFILFQGIGAIVSIVLVVSRVGISELQNLPNLIQENLDLVIAGNSVGQITILGAGSWLMVKLSFPGKRVADVIGLSVAPHVPLSTMLAFALIVAFQPIVMLLSWINLQVPFPEAYLNFEKQQTKLLEEFLSGDHILLITLFHIAVVPAFCEEIMYRGFALRLLEKRWAIAKVILVTGFVFGAYHLRLTQLLPLSTLGVLLAWITWRTGSLVPAIMAHFVNNGASVIAARYFPELVFSETMTEEFPPISLIILGGILSVALIHFIQKTTNKTQE